MKKRIELVTAVIGAGAQVTGCRFGPDALIASGIVAALRDAGHAAFHDAGRSAVRDLSCDADPAQAAQAADKMATVSAFTPRLADTVRGVVANGRFPLVLGGDHSCAVGTWSGIADAWHATGRIGLIWIDAHLDSHTPQTSDSQAPHGMPLAALLGHGAPALTDLYDWRAKLLPQHVVVIGARSYEPGEMALLQRLGVRVMDIDEVERRGLNACVAEAIDIVSRGTHGYGVTFDLDAIDPGDVSAVGSPEARGIGADAAVAALRGFAGDARLLGFELVEYNPELDDAARRGAAVCRELVMAALGTDATAGAPPHAAAGYAPLAA
ncbi:arginase [Robbsia sp. Bb-Pol-6]|uniref:Arginase n=1 Tax=Robbsia betulipollinis TaxID=2981849 RepID=A0ABT3ZRM5_9BURK|nr:arginase [Robbsia betulipollinis]